MRLNRSAESIHNSRIRKNNAGRRGTESERENHLWGVFTQHQIEVLMGIAIKWYFIMGSVDCKALQNVLMLNMHKLYGSWAVFLYMRTQYVRFIEVFVFGFCLRWTKEKKCQHSSWFYRVDLDDSIWFLTLSACPACQFKSTLFPYTRTHSFTLPIIFSLAKPSDFLIFFLPSPHTHFHFVQCKN